MKDRLNSALFNQTLRSNPVLPSTTRLVIESNCIAFLTKCKRAGAISNIALSVIYSPHFRRWYDLPLISRLGIVFNLNNNNNNNNNNNSNIALQKNAILSVLDGIMTCRHIIAKKFPHLFAHFTSYNYIPPLHLHDSSNGNNIMCSVDFILPQKPGLITIKFGSTALLEQYTYVEKHLQRIFLY